MKILSFMKKKDQMDIFVYYAKLMIEKPVKIGIFMIRKASSKWFYELFTNYMLRMRILPIEIAR
jgi:hypothetical protein